MSGSGELASNAWSVVALAVPFLLRVAADPGLTRAAVRSWGSR